ncbi:MAG: bifunctional DNA-formamidopyrimidine glycosylase/DNA-(apurinic or apyrimidinic site) lyase [Myxococcales bacterium]|nr:bifunctional DNA-formamidopyrimidine glycosylase/DNA-(apurinic or apyrimidinic site) lyase [Myxococcales bacterium]
MPELPEVEVAARALRRWLVGAPIARVRTKRSNVVASRLGTLRGQTCSAVERRGKWLRISFDTTTLFSHLGMTGKWVERAPTDRALAHEHAVFTLAERSVRYVDPRAFGRLVLAKRELPAWTALGPDPLLDGVDPARLRGRRAIKDVLLDQSVLAGIGNIQATEALFHARIHPERAANELSDAERAALADGIGWTLQRTLALEDGTEITYLGEKGSENPFVVYGRAGEPCPSCRRALERIVQAGRTTTFCARCQPRRR